MADQMKPDDFIAWLKHMKITGRKASELLGCGVNTIVKYKRDGAPLYIALACSALAQGLPPWRDTKG